MPVLQDPDMLQLNNTELYNVWKGELYIQEQRACNIKFKSSGSCSIPVQLGNKLEIKEAIRLSELRKALPVQIFDQISFTGQEGCFESIYYTLYAVKSSSINGFDIDKLLEWMKDQELALIKVLHDQGFLILLTSSALQCSEGLSVKDSFQLFALFLFPNSQLLDNTGRDDLGYKLVKEDISLKISELLPGLQYAILETRQMQKGKDLYPDTLVEQHFKQFASLQGKNVSVGELKAGTSNTLSLFSGHGKDIADKTDQLFFSRLQSYISSPVNFSVPLVKMSSLLKEEIPLSSDSEKCGKNIIGKDSVALESKIPLLAAINIKSDGSSGNHVLNENKKQPAKKRTFKKGGRRGARKGKRKLKHQTALPSSATSENQVASKKRKLSGGDQEQAVSSNRTTVKLASAPLAHKRKRGAEVLTAEFVIDDKVSETETTVTNQKSQEKGAVLKNKLHTGKARKKASTDTQIVRDRPPKRKASDPGNRNKLTEAKAKSEIVRRPVIKNKEKSGKQSKRTTVSINTVPFEPASSFSKTSMDHSLTSRQSAHLAPVPETDIMEKRISMYESHALNLLADLALNSLSSSSISYINSESTTPISETVAQEKVPDSDGATAVEYPQNDSSSPLKSSSDFEEPVQTPDGVKGPPKAGSDASPAQQRAENAEKPSSHKMLLAAAKAKARNNTTSKICLEHSYSQLPREDAQDKSTKDLSEKPSQSVSEPTETSSDSEEVLDQASDFLVPREFLQLTGDNGYPSLTTKPREGSKYRDNFFITFKWEAKYDFDLDSKFTSDPLEKTINRALHGPWNPNLKEKVEDVKIILHMWLALFYSKPSQQVISSSRKVVEHSNPAKYVSINTVHDPLCEIVETDAADAENGDESDLMRNSPHAQPQIMLGVSPVLHEMKEKHGSNQPVDLTVASKIQTKDYNINLSSEIFQICNQSSLSALYTNSLQTTVMCKMTSTSKVAPPPTNNTNTIFSANIPTLCYTDDGKQFNTELTAKSETCVAFGGGSSGKADSKESEHELSKHSSSAEETQMSNDSEKGFRTLPEDSRSTVSKNAENVENGTPVLPEPVSRIQVEALNNGRLSLTSDGNQQTTTRSEGIPHEHTSLTSSTVDDTEVSPSDALNMNSTSDVFHEDDGHSGHSDTEEELLKKRNPLVPRIQNVLANTEQHESILESVGDRDLLEAKLQGVDMDLAVRQHSKEKEQVTSNVHLDVTKLGVCEENNQTNALKSSRFRENLSPLKSLNYGSNISPLKDGKALESGIRLSDDKRLTQRPNTSRIFLEFVHREKSSMPSGSQDRAKSNIDLLAENTKKVDSCTGIECNVGKASIIDLKLTANSIKEATTSSSTNETLEKKSDEQEEYQNESLPAKKDAREIAPFGNMEKLELSPSSSDISDIEDINTEKTVEETLHSNKKPDRVDASAEAPVAAFHQDDDRSPEDDQFHVNRNTVAIQITHPSTDINETEKTEENLPVQNQSPSQPCDVGADKINNLTTVSADFQDKGTEAVYNFLQPIEVENISDVDESENPPDNTQTPCGQEVGPPISVEILGEDGKTYFGEKSLSGSEASKFADSESLGEKASLLGSDSSKAADLECISVFEKLSLKAAEEIFTNPISTLAKKQELQIHGIEILPADKETIDNSPSVDLLNMQPDLDTEDHMVPDIMEIGNSCEVLQSPEAVDEVAPAITLVGKSKSYETIHDSGGATNQPVSKCVDTNVDDLFIESQSDSTSDDVNVSLSPYKYEKSTEDQTEIKRNRLRKEILSRLKLICQGSGIGHASSNSEDEVFIVHEKPGKERAEEQTDTKIGDSKHEVNTVSLVESTSDIQKNQTLELEILEEEIVQEIAENNPSINLTESVICQEAEKPASQEKCVSSLRDDFTDHIDQDPGQNQSDICCILNTGSISKEQYDRWSETSDDDIEFVRAYKEPLANKASKYLQKESHEVPSSPAEALTTHLEPSRSRKEKHSKRNSGPNTSRRETGEYASKYHRDPDYSSPRPHRSFIITKKSRDVGRTRPMVHKESIHAGRSDYDSLFVNRRMVSSDLTQNTLDMEHLRFMCRLKEVLRKSSTDLRVFEPPFQTMFDSRRIPGFPRSRTKSISPLLITVRCTPHRRDYRKHDSLFQSSSYSQAYEDELRNKPTYYSRTPKKVRTRRYASPYHFNRLRHEGSLEKPNSDISVIIRECTQSNHLKLSRVGLGGTAVERTSACSAPEEGDRQLRQTFDPASTKSQTVGNIISDLCTNLHSRLHGIAIESTQKNCYFYLSKTNVDQDEDDDDKDDDFFSLTKSLLIKDGYAPIEPQDFCDSEQEESKKLLVIIRNENVSSQMHKIPCLLQLRLLPNVTFAGVDTPEDLPESMYQELLQSGGFVVSDRAVLENITIDKLKEVLTILEKLNRTSAWKWLIHYGDYRKLKEDKRAESASRVKIPLLKSYQQSNIVEILPYHRCDSRSKDLSSDLDCLLSLQSQHIRSRLAVFLTVMPSTEDEELEQNGILVYDVDTFIRRIQKVDAQLQPSVWS
ncbi:protein TASOR 2 isoform X2 [Lithobates pipiens]